VFIGGYKLIFSQLLTVAALTPAYMPKSEPRPKNTVDKIAGATKEKNVGLKADAAD
jgi:hypothetical protein